ncbi:MAG: lipoprotein-releasing ABC transporter permease subunit [Betaproteobacteria bacterium]|nr:lipoprotein-releasing ABC transporter permease subunit [Betaproteobacteria bacterium]
MSRPAPLGGWPFEWQVGWRYTRAGRGGAAAGRPAGGFLSFISAVSVLGIALGVAALIIVLSVMNGFQKEVRDRMLAVVAHVELHAPPGEALPDWRATAAAAARHPQVRGSAPFVATQALLGRGDVLRGAQVRGIDPAAEAQVTPLAARERALFAALEPGAWQIILGGELAWAVGARVGDKVTVMAPSGQVTPAGVVPRMRQFTVAGTFVAGHHDYDASFALVHIEDAARLFRTGGVSAVQLRLADPQLARRAGAELQTSLAGHVPPLEVRDWTRSNRNWFDAVQVEKRLMFIILALIVAVAAFNLVSTLVMTVTDKRADIAILRTLGASPRSIMGIFVVQGAAAGIIGTLAGLVLGLVVAFNIETIVPAIERALGIAFLPGNVYLISRMPSQPLAADIVPVVAIALVLAFGATLYPSWRASRTNPAEALRHE